MYYLTPLQRIVAHVMFRARMVIEDLAEPPETQDELQLEISPYAMRDRDGGELILLQHLSYLRFDPAEVDHLHGEYGRELSKTPASALVCFSLFMDQLKESNTAGTQITDVLKGFVDKVRELPGCLPNEKDVELVITMLEHGVHSYVYGEFRPIPVHWFQPPLGKAKIFSYLYEPEWTAAPPFELNSLGHKKADGAEKV